MKQLLLISIIIITTFFGCGTQTGTNSDEFKNYIPPKMDYSVHKLPAGLRWITNNNEPIIASPNAKKGGAFYTFTEAFPHTFRVVGPDSNNFTRSYFNGNKLSLLSMHPNTEKPIPSLATHWAYGRDGKTMYFKINKKAKWSDGKPVTANDFIYTLEFMRNKYIRAPWYNDYYTREIKTVKKYSEYIISVTATKKMPELWMVVDLIPTPKHFYHPLTKDFVRKYNYAVVPNTGPYQLYKFEKGRYLLFKRKKDWWAKDLRYNKNRYNVDFVNIKVIYDRNKTYQYFIKGKIDSYRADIPQEWHAKGRGPVFAKGYVEKLTFYNEIPRPTMGLFINLNKPIFKNIQIRRAFAHAINFNKVNKEVFLNEYARLQSFYSGVGQYTNRRIRARSFNIKTVEQIMKKAGWKRGQDGIWGKQKNRFSVKVSFSNPLFRQRMVLIKEEAKKAGVEIILRELDRSSSYREIMEKKHQVSYMGWVIGIRPSPWQAFHSDNANKPQTNNVNNLADTLMDSYIDRYRKSINKFERIMLSKQIQKRIYDLCVWIPMERIPFTREFHWRWLKYPIIPGPKNLRGDSKYPFFYGYYWIDQKIKKETKKAMRNGKAFKQVNKVITKYKK